MSSAAPKHDFAWAISTLLCLGQPLHGFLLAFGCLHLIRKASVLLICNGIERIGLIENCQRTALFTACLALYAGIVCGVSFFHLFRPSIKRLSICIFTSILSAVFFPIASFIAMCWFFFKKRLHVSLILVVFAFLTMLLFEFNLLPTRWYVFCNGYLPPAIAYACLAAAILIATKGRPVLHTAIAFAPALLCLLTIAVLQLQFQHVRADNQAIRQQISEIVGFPMDKDNFRKHVESGLDPSTEPLASFLKAAFNLPNQQDLTEYEVIPTLGKERIDQLAKELYETNPGFEETVFAFTATKPQKIAHHHDWDNKPAMGMLLPELSQLRLAARLLQLQIAIDPRDKAKLARNNDALIALRDCALQGDTLISRLVGGAIENIRIRTLCSTLPYLSYTENEWQQLLGGELAWNRLVALAFVDELGMYEDIKECVLAKRVSMGDLAGEEEDLTALQSFFPQDYLLLMFEIDNNFALRTYRLTIELSQETFPEMAELDKLKDSVRTAMESGCLLSAMMMPALSKAMARLISLHDMRRMACLAHQVFDYKAKNGTFPESLALLSDDIHDVIKHKPFLLETSFDLDEPLDTMTSARNVFGFFTSSSFADDGFSEDDEGNADEEAIAAEEQEDDDAFKAVRIAAQYQDDPHIHTSRTQDALLIPYPREKH